MNNGYVQSLSDNDLYKYSMQNAVCLTYPKFEVIYELINRDGREFPEGFGKELKRIVETFRGLSLSKDGKDFFRKKCYYFSPFYIDFLNGYQYDPNEVVISQEGPILSVKIQGYWYRTILWEPPLMATISQLYFEMTGKDGKFNRQKRKENNINKASAFKAMGITAADFGTRRRESFENQDEVVGDLIKYGGGFLIGSSNVELAMQYDIIPTGTQAHEWYMFHAALFGFRMANEIGMERWINVYEGNLGIALPDTFTTDVFLRSFNSKYARLFDGVRQDSGNPVDFANKIIEHYKKLRIDPLSKLGVFSDNIKSISLVASIHKTCKGRIKDSYGIGTWFSNDTGLKPLNIVIKLIYVKVESSWIPTVKLSDDPRKNTGDAETVDLCKQLLRI